jgi:hypothetical protein
MHTKTCNNSCVADHVADFNDRELKIVAQNQWQCRVLNSRSAVEKKVDTNEAPNALLRAQIQEL